MSGSYTCSFTPKPLRALAILLVLLVAASVASGPAQAHVLKKRWRERRHIKHRALSQRGTRYNYGGTSPRSGFDCSGFTRWTFDGHGARLPHSALDQFRLAGHHGYRRIWKRRKLRKGDLVFFKTTSARVGHVGIYVGHKRFIASNSSSGVRVESIHDPYYWGPRYVGATRPPALQPRD